MRTKPLYLLLLFGLLLTFLTPEIQAENSGESQTIQVSLQKRVPSDSVKGETVIVQDIQQWNPKETAIIICDMWNQHWCKGATERVGEMAPFMNNVLTIARDKGGLIVHAPSECIKY